MAEPFATPEGGEPAGADEVLTETLLRALIEQIPLTTYIDRLDAISSNVYTSPQLEATLGYTLQEWVEDEELLTKIVHPDDRDAVLAEHERTREQRLRPAHHNLGRPAQLDCQRRRPRPGAPGRLHRVPGLPRPHATPVG